MILWWHEARRAGWAACTAPAAVLLVVVLAAVFSARTGAPRSQVERLLLIGLEAFLPLTAAMVFVTVVARDRGRELQLALPTGYVTTLGRRLAVPAIATTVLAVAFAAGLRVTGWWSGPPVRASVLVWAPPLLWLSGLALLVAALGRSVVLATTAAAAVWLVEQVFAPPMVGSPWLRPFFLFMTSRVGTGTGWAANRAGLAISGALLLTVAFLLLRRPEHLLTEEEV